jgi:hypothetical protein
MIDQINLNDPEFDGIFNKALTINPCKECGCTISVDRLQVGEIYKQTGLKPYFVNCENECGGKDGFLGYPFDSVIYEWNEHNKRGVKQ